VVAGLRETPSRVLDEALSSAGPNGGLVSVQAFFYVLVTGAALLAMWILVRYAGFGPRSLFWAGAHAVVAYVLLRLVPVVLGTIGTGEVVARYAAVFGVVLPMFVYGFLSGGWVTRAAVGHLRP
jgi:hypothetical protein